MGIGRIGDVTRDAARRLLRVVRRRQNVRVDVRRRAVIKLHVEDEVPQHAAVAVRVLFEG